MKAIQQAQAKQVYTFECQKECKKCCLTNVVTLLPSELPMMQWLAKKHRKTPMFTKDLSLNTFKMIAFPCPFLDLSRKEGCLIYEHRPLICRSYPIRPHPRQVILDGNCPWVKSVMQDRGSEFYDKLPLNGMTNELKAARIMAAQVTGGT